MSGASSGSTTGSDTVDHPERVEVETSIAAPIGRVWELLVDVDLPSRFSREFQGGQWLEEPGLGARFRGHNRIGDVEWSTTCIVTEFRVGEAFTWVVESTEHPVAVWGYTLVDRGDDLLLRMHATLGPAQSPPRRLAASDPEHAEEIIAKRLGHWRKNMTATVEGIKALSEA